MANKQANTSDTGRAEGSAPVNGPASYFPSIERTYGRPFSNWKDIIRAHPALKHMELVKLLKSDHGVGHGHANALVAHTLCKDKAGDQGGTVAATVGAQRSRRVTGVDDRPIVRLRRAGDVPALCDVLAAQQPGSRYPYQWPLPFPVEKFIVREVEEQAWVAEVGGRPAGHVAASSVVDRGDGIAGRWAEAAGTGMDGLVCVSVLFVDRRLRSRGIGGALLDTAVGWARKAGRVPVLDVVNPDGDAAGLYRHGGWVEVGEARPFWLPDTEPPVLLMILPPEG